ncbi:MT-A70 family protein [Oxytricha trifallax]|uniref:MT-A70 family protein n=1 Tax=Oxytricha trifallax TaxID=1172189 RepID=A0A073I128_9SPIT|nr:MT-A70 family protein [Oxytricha trifallax]
MPKKREKLEQGEDGKFNCPYYDSCKQKYQGETPGAVYKHASSQHKEQAELLKAAKRFMCSCSKRYTRKADLVYHQQQKGHSDPEIVSFEADVRDKREWIKLREWAKQKYNGNVFDVIVANPPLSGAMTEEEIMSVPIDLVQDRGFVFLCTTSAKRSQFETYLQGRGYNVVTTMHLSETEDENSQTNEFSLDLFASHKMFIVGMKGDETYLQNRFNVQKMQKSYMDMRISESFKITSIYQIIEEICPGGHFLDVYAKFINRRPCWVGFGLEAKQMRNQDHE